MDDKTYKIITANDYFGEPADFIICWETVCMSCTFAVGFQTDKRNELSIFHVTNMGGEDIYNILDTCYLEVYSVRFPTMWSLPTDTETMWPGWISGRKCGSILLTGTW